MSQIRSLIIATFLGALILALVAPAHADRVPITHEISDKLAPQPPPPYDPNVLDWGIYWFGTGNVSEKAHDTNPYFDPAKPTVIFVHGWQPDTLGNRNSFNWQENDPSNGVNVDMADAWIADGWNIGIFFWNQLADEGAEVKDAEAKIWTATGPQGMRWRLPNGSYTTTGSPTVSAGELFYDSYKEAMDGFSGSTVRVVGHSLGNQMAIRLTHLTYQGIQSGEIAPNLLPDRLALMDPFWSRDPKGYLGNRWVAEEIRDIVGHDLLPEGVVLEWYRSSAITGGVAGDSNDPMQPMIHYADMRPQFCAFWDQSCKHNAAWPLYFWSYDFPMTPEVICDSWDWLGNCNNYSPTGFGGGLAQTSDSRLWDMMAHDYKWDQRQGMGSSSPGDHTYTPYDEPGTPFSIAVTANPTQEMVGNYSAITADVDRDNSNPVQDNTVAGFTTDLGQVTAVFSITQSGSGIAGTMVTSPLPGFATVTGTSGTTDTAVVEFVAPCQTIPNSMTVTGSPAGADLSWNWADGGNHELWHSNAPYFLPGDGVGAKMTETAVNSYLDSGALGDPATHHFYLVRRLTACSAHLGAIDYGLTAGS